MPKRNGFRTDRPGSPGLAPWDLKNVEPGQGGETMNELDSGRDGRLIQMIQRNPMSSVLTGFGLGLGFGLTVTLLISRRREERGLSEPCPKPSRIYPSGSSEFRNRWPRMSQHHGRAREREKSQSRLTGSFYKRSRAGGPGSFFDTMINVNVALQPSRTAKDSGPLELAGSQCLGSVPAGSDWTRSSWARELEAAESGRR